MYLDCFKNNGKPYLRIVENYTETVNGKKKKMRKTIKNLGLLVNYDDGKPNFIKRMKKQLMDGTLKIDGINSCDFKIRNRLLTVYNNEFVDENDIYLNLKNIGYFFLDGIYNNLGISEILNLEKSRSKIEYDLNGLTKLLVFGRILDPKSKKATFKDKGKYLFPITSSTKEIEIYRALDVLDKKSNSIQTRMNTKIKQSSIGRNTYLTYYDVTNYFFETMYGDDDVFKLDEEGNKILDDKGKPIILEKGLRKKGVCKNNTPNPLVAMGLFIDNNGLPVSYDIFPGNTQDKTVFKEVIKNSINKKDLGKIIVVADNGMYAQENMYLLVDKGNGYIISKSVKKHWNTKLTKEEEKQGMKILREWALDEEDYVYSYNENGTIRTKTKSRIYNRTLKDSDGNTITIKEKQVLFWSKKHYDKELHQNEKFIEYLESCKEHPDKLKDKQRKSQEFIKVLQTDKKTGEVVKTKPLVVLLEDKIQKYKETMGFYSIVTSEVDMKDVEIKQRYHGLSRIEDSFRIIKSDLEGRPIYVWTKEHINAHFLICFIALTIIRLIQYKVLTYLGKDTLNLDGWESGITAEKIKESLNNFQVDKSNNLYYKTTKPDEYIELISTVLGKTFDVKIPKSEELKKYKDQLYTSL